MDIVQHGARSIAHVRQVKVTAAQPPHQKAIDGTKERLSLFSLLPKAGYVVQQPGQLGAREIGIHHQACLVLDDVRPALSSELVAGGGRAPALPDDGIVQWPACVPIPDHGRFSLIGNAGGCQLAGANACLLQHLPGCAQLCPPYSFGIVLHPARLRIDLRELLLRCVDRMTGVIKNDGPGTGRTLIQGKDVFCHACQRLLGDCYSFHGLSALSFLGFAIQARGQSNIERTALSFLAVYPYASLVSLDGHPAVV